MGKPSDFFLGITDFFAVLVPGAFAMWLALQYLPQSVACHLDVGVAGTACAKGSEALRWLLFSLGSYVLGAFVFQAGSQLDGAYDKWRKRIKPPDSDRCFQRAKALAAEMTPDLTGEFTVFKWARVYVQLHSPEARLDVDRLEASHKLFRSLVVVAMAAAAHFLLTKQDVGSALAAGAFAMLSFGRYCSERWKMTELAYSSAVIIHAKNKTI